MIVWELEIRVGLVGGGGISGRPKILRLDSGQVWRKHVDQICQVTTPGFECGTSNLGSNHFSAEIPLAVCESPSIGLSSETRYPRREHRPVQCFSFDT